MEYKNNHYVPQFIIKKYGNYINLFNLKNNSLHLKQKSSSVFAFENFYSEELEKNFNKVESDFSNFLANNFIKNNDKVTIKRKQIWLIKKFLLLQMYRVKSSKDTISEDLKLGQKIKKIFPDMFDFEEVVFKNETTHQRWERNLKLFIECDNLVDLKKHKDKTYESLYWMQVFNTAYLGFWSSEDSGEDFLLSDIGMVSENEIGWNEITNLNNKKSNVVLNLIQQNFSDNEIKKGLAKILTSQTFFHENFMIFPISKNKIIALINPFYELYETKMISIENIKLTMVNNIDIFKKNISKYKDKDFSKKTFLENDDFIYQIHDLNIKDVI